MHHYFVLNIKSKAKQIRARQKFYIVQKMREKIIPISMDISYPYKNKKEENPAFTKTNFPKPSNACTL